MMVTIYEGRYDSSSQPCSKYLEGEAGETDETGEGTGAKHGRCQFLIHPYSYGYSSVDVLLRLQHDSPRPHACMLIRGWQIGDSYYYSYGYYKGR